MVKGKRTGYGVKSPHLMEMVAREGNGVIKKPHPLAASIGGAGGHR